jgi:hypothetical protein
VKGVRIKVFDFSTKQEIISYQLDDANSETAIILATLYRRQNVWKFKAIGQGYEKGLAVLAQSFGVDIEPENPAEIKLPHKFTRQASHLPSPSPTQFHAHPHNKNESLVSDKALLADSINIHDTNALTLKAQYEPIEHWFKRKHIPVEINADAMDTSGFFDEAAVALGDNYAVLKIVSNKIKYRQLNNKERAYIELADIDDKDSEAIKKFCKELYDYSFVAKYFIIRKKN